ncbi:hypothetical protein FRB90_000110 [Tulasnella sp. 427]|nr:hypothetical protein FRB90_000110 [Tulasnella sp. 427]
MLKLLKLHQRHAIYSIPNRLTPEHRLFDTTSRITALNIDFNLNPSAEVLFEYARTFVPSEVLFPSLQSLEYTRGPAQHHRIIHKAFAGSLLKRLVINSYSDIYDGDIDGVPGIVTLLKQHSGLETLEARGFAFELSKEYQLPWPPGLRNLQYSAAWDFDAWSDLVGRCHELRVVKIGADYWRTDREYQGTLAQYSSHPTIVAQNIRTLDLTGVHSAHRLLPILCKTEMPKLREISFNLASEAMRDDLESEVDDALGILAKKSPELRSLTVNTWIPLLETHAMSKFSNMETLHISNSAGEHWPWVYHDEDVMLVTQSMPRLKHLRLPGLTTQRPMVTTLGLESLAVHCKDFESLSISLDATHFHGQEDMVTPFSSKLTSMTFSPLWLPVNVAEPFAWDLCMRMPGVDGFHGSVMGVDEHSRAFYWDGGLKILQNMALALRTGDLTDS